MLSDIELAFYIFDWLEKRNGGELKDALDNMRVCDQRLAHEELALILSCRGKPPNWVMGAQPA
jgi:hypothetical protein